MARRQNDDAVLLNDWQMNGVSEWSLSEDAGPEYVAKQMEQLQKFAVFIPGPFIIKVSLFV